MAELVEIAQAAAELGVAADAITTGIDKTYDSISSAFNKISKLYRTITGTTVSYYTPVENFERFSAYRWLYLDDLSNLIAKLSGVEYSEPASRRGAYGIVRYLNTTNQVKKFERLRADRAIVSLGRRPLLGPYLSLVRALSLARNPTDSEYNEYRALFFASLETLRILFGDPNAVFDRNSAESVFKITWTEH